MLESRSVVAETLLLEASPRRHSRRDKKLVLFLLLFGLSFVALHRRVLYIRCEGGPWSRGSSYCGVQLMRGWAERSWRYCWRPVSAKNGAPLVAVRQVLVRHAPISMLAGEASAGKPLPHTGRLESRVSLPELLKRLEGTKMHTSIPEDGLFNKFICTHHGKFHADEVMACTMLKCLPEYASLPIVRTRNQTHIEKASIVVDVGATYEPAKHRYDHHQTSFIDTFSETYPEIKLSSAGLVFKHFGQAVVSALCGQLPEADSAAVVAKAYDTLIRELDALDNGVPIADTEPRYRVVTHLGARVARLNPSWQESASLELENERFKKAMAVAANELWDILTGISTDWLPARSIVQEALETRYKGHPSGEIIKLPRFCPWQDHLFDLEEEAGKHEAQPLAKYIIFMDGRGGWRVQAAPKYRGSFENRLPLPDSWRGLRDKELSDAVGIGGCVFVHASGFIGGHETEEGANFMAAKALELGQA